MKYLTLLTCLVAGIAVVPPAASQATPPVPFTAPRVERPPTPRALRAPRPPEDVDWPSGLRAQEAREERQRELMQRDVDRQAELEERQREMQEAQLERQRGQEERQRLRMREMEDRQRERELELGEQMRQRMTDLDRSTPLARPLDLVRPLPAEMPLTPVPSLPPRASEEALVPESLDGAFLNRRPPRPWAHGDPADSLYRVAREALNRGDYRRAAQLFNDLTQRFPNSSYAYMSAYWEAFSRYRIGTIDELKAADRALRGLVGRSAPSGNGWREDTDVNGLRTRIRGALALRGDVGMADVVEQTARQAGASCDQEDLTVRVEALNALAQMDAAAALPIMRRVLERKDECLVELRKRAVFMLARRADSEATTLLVSTAKYDPNINVRTDAISYLPRVPGDAALTALEEILRTSDDERIQRAAARAIMSSDNPRARTSLRALLERSDAPEALRLQMLEAYSREHNTPDDAAYLRWLYPRAESDRVKGAIIGALARIGGKDNKDWLVGLVRNTSEPSPLRSTALQWLVRADLPSGDLVRMYEAADSRSMREQVISALARSKEPEATDRLIDIVKNSTDLEMRRLAINALSRKNDPRATKLLMELIEK